MTPYEHERFQRELTGDFSDIDNYLMWDRIKMYLVAGGITLCLLLNWLLP